MLKAIFLAIRHVILATEVVAFLTGGSSEPVGLHHCFVCPLKQGETGS